MKLTSKGRYAVTAILDIALNAQDGPVTLADISGRQNISLSYLEQLFAKLRHQGLVKSVRGPGGGYQLGLESDKISVAMIIASVNEHINVTRCSGEGNCKDGTECLTHSLWEQLSNRIEDFLNNITLAELVSQQNKQRVQKHSKISREIEDIHIATL